MVVPAAPPARERLRTHDASAADVVPYEADHYSPVEDQESSRPPTEQQRFTALQSVLPSTMPPPPGPATDHTAAPAVRPDINPLDGQCLAHPNASLVPGRQPPVRSVPEATYSSSAFYTAKRARRVTSTSRPLDDPTHPALDAANTATQPGLPSPALSDDGNDNPPQVSHGTSKAGQIQHPDQNQVRRSAADRFVPMTSTWPIPVPTIVDLRSSHTRQPVRANPARNITHQGFSNMQRTAMPLGNQPSESPSMQPVHAGTFSATERASRIPASQLLGMIEQAAKIFAPDLAAQSTEAFRLYLLRQAIEREDWFHMTLHQLFCLRAVAPRSLPLSMASVDERAWHCVEAALYPNSTVNPQLLLYCAEFPENIMAMYSSDAHDLYELRVKLIRRWLDGLPQSWPGLLRACKERQSPPLTQDMVDGIGLLSPVMQLAVSTAIGRMLWPSDYSRAVVPLVRLLRLDQETYSQRPQRTPQEMNHARELWKTVLTQAWQHHLTGRPGRYMIPLEVWNWFAGVKSTPAISGGSLASTGMAASQYLPQSLAPPSSGVQQTNGQHTLVGSTSIPGARHVGVEHVHAAMTNATRSNHFASLQPPLTMQTTIPGNLSLYLFPLDGRRLPQPAQPDPTRSALHQVHLRSPLLKAATAHMATQTLYRFVSGYGLPPIRLDPSLAVQNLTFNVSTETYGKLPKILPPESVGGLPQYVFEKDSIFYRLRLSMIPDAGFPTDNSWATAESHWPEDISITISGPNGKSKPLEKRRKLHHGRDLPIDLTPHLTTGINTLKICINNHKGDKNKKNKTEYALAVERICFKNHDSIREGLSRLSVDESLASIKQSLTTSEGDDEDMIMTSQATTISLFDPIGGGHICETPVRGSSCLHRDCFDLDTFLSQRPRDRPDAPTVVDCWRCPICRGDVRPPSLVLDEFLVQVREVLAERDLLDTRAITVNADGSWEPKEDRKINAPAATPTADKKGGINTPQKHIEVIEID